MALSEAFGPSTAQRLTPRPREDNRSVETEAEFIFQISKDTWNCLVQMSDTPTGLIKDRFEGERTKITNVGLFMTAILGAEELGYISTNEANNWLKQNLEVLAEIPKENGFIPEWIDTNTGQPLYEWENNPDYKLNVSPLDFAWLGISLETVASAKPEFREQVELILGQANLENLINPETGKFIGGISVITGEQLGWEYDTLENLSEARILEYFSEIRNFKPKSSYRGEFNNGKRKIPRQTLGGSLFEGAMPSIFIEEEYFKGSLKAIIEHQIIVGDYFLNGHWGVSVCDDPTLGYKEMGIGGKYPFRSVVTPHAVCLAIPFFPEDAISELKKLKAEYPDIYKEGIGFKDSVDVDTDQVAKGVNSLDQLMLFLSLVNYQTGNYIPRILQKNLL